MIDFSSIKDSSIKSMARSTVFSELVEALTTIYGESNVTVTGSGSVAICTGWKDDKEICVEVKVSAKDFVDRNTDKKGLIRAFDRNAAGNAYSDHVAEQEAKAAQKAAAKEKKIAADTERRAREAN